MGLRVRNRALNLIGPFQTRPATVCRHLAVSTLTFLFSEKKKEKKKEVHIRRKLARKST